MSTDETAPAPVAEEGDSTRRAGYTKTLKFKIEKAKLLLVEGKDEDLFFTSALEKHLGIGSIQVLPLAGKEQLSRNLAALKRDPKFVEVTSLAVIRDADTAADAAFQSVCGALRRRDFMPPDRTPPSHRAGRGRASSSCPTAKGTECWRHFAWIRLPGALKQAVCAAISTAWAREA